MNKEKFSILKRKITPKETVEQNSSNQDRFTVADNILIPTENEIKKSLVLRKTFSIPEDEIMNFKRIKQHIIIVCGRYSCFKTLRNSISFFFNHLLHHFSLFSSLCVF